MNGKSSIAGALIAMLGLIFYAYSNPSVAVTNAPPTRTQQSRAAVSFSYAQLTVDGEQFIFDEGGAPAPRSRTMTALIRFFGSSDRPTYVNLLNAIGSRGWELVPSDTDEGIITFKRQL